MDARAFAAMPPGSLAYRLLDRWQRRFPLDERPWSVIAAALGSSEDAVLDVARRAAAAGVLARVGAVFRPNTVGASTLAAFAVPPGQLDAIAARVSAHPEVNHNYAREHAVNLWFVAAAPDADALVRALDAIERDGGLPLLRLPLVRDYAIDLGFPLAGRRAAPSPTERPTAPLALDARDRRLLAALDDGLALVARPWADLARRAGVTDGWARVRIAQWLNLGAIARLGLVLRHRPLGWTANAMCVWDVPDEQADALGLALAGEDGVTLAYRRARDGAWRHNLYAMIHGRERAAVEDRRDAIAARLGLDRHPHATLFSTRAYVQRGARYGRAETATAAA